MYGLMSNSRCAVRLEVIRKRDDGIIEILFGYPVNLALAMEAGKKSPLSKRLLTPKIAGNTPEKQLTSADDKICGDGS